MRLHPSTELTMTSLGVDMLQLAGGPAVTTSAGAEQHWILRAAARACKFADDQALLDALLWARDWATERRSTAEILDSGTYMKPSDLPILKHPSEHLLPFKDVREEGLRTRLSSSRLMALEPRRQHRPELDCFSSCWQCFPAAACDSVHTLSCPVPLCPFNGLTWPDLGFATITARRSKAGISLRPRMQGLPSCRLT